MPHTLRYIRIGGIALFGLLLMLGATTPVAAQSDAHVAVGVEVSKRFYTDNDFSKGIRPGFLYRIRRHRHPRNGWRFRFPAFGFNWGRADVEMPVAGADTELGQLRARGLLVGVAEALVKNEGKDEISFNVLAGPTWMHFFVDQAARDAYHNAGNDLISIHAGNTIAVRPGASYWHDISKRLGFHAALNYVIQRPEVEIRTAAGSSKSRWTADYFAVKAGIAVKVF